MKKTLLISLLSMFSTLRVSFAQNVTIPDANFKAALLSDANINTVDDGEISLAEAASFNGSIDCSSLSIADLTGIEAFTAITELRCNSNDLTSLDITQNTALTLLRCQGNDLTTLDVSQNTLLKELTCSNNSLTSLDVSANIDLEDFTCRDNELSSLDVSNNINLKLLVCGNNPISSLDVSQNNKLTHLWCYSNELTSINVTNLPDLVDFQCYRNDISSLDVSQNPLMERLRCFDMLLTELDVSVNTELTWLECYNNDELSDLNIDQNALLNRFWCHRTKIPHLDLRHMTNLSKFSCSNNDELKYLNLDNGNNDKIASGDFFAIELPKLTCINVSDEAYAQANWTNIDDGTSFTGCVCLVRIPDANFKATLVADNNIDTDMDDQISCDEAEAFTGTIDVGGLNISDVTGLEAFINLTGFAAVTNQITTIDLTALTKLETLNLNNNGLSSIDVSNNTALTFLALTNNNLSSIDVSLNTALTVMSVSQNNITTLDVSMLTELIELYARSNSIETLDLTNNTSLRRIVVYSNALTTLNVKNGNNSNVIAFSAHTNPSLNCITVDDVTYSENTWTNIDAGVSFSTGCSLENSVSKTDILERSLYPNPVSSSFYVETPINTTYRVQNLFGQTVLEGNLESGTNQIDVNTLDEGVYLFVPQEAKAHRFVKQ